MNIYEWMRAVSNDSLRSQGTLTEALDMIDGLEKSGAFGTVVRATHGNHRFTKESSYSPHCAFCGKPESEHAE